jgi:hypothetical protein
MERTLALAAIVLVAALLPDARAERLGGNFRGPDDSYLPREDPVPRRAPAAFLPGVEAGRREAAFTGKPMLVFFVLPGCETCRAVADGSFGDAEIADLVARFVPVLADAEREEAFGLASGVRTFPTILLLDPRGNEAGRVEGAVFPAELAAALRAALRRIGPVSLRKGARDLAKASAAVLRAREAKEWRALLAAVARVERIGHEGPELDAARAARAEASAEAAVRLDGAKKALKAGRRDEARRTFAAIAREFEGLDEAVEARNLLLEMDGRPPKDGGKGGGQGQRQEPGYDERMRRGEGELEIDPVTSEQR